MKETWMMEAAEAYARFGMLPSTTAGNAGRTDSGKADSGVPDSDVSDSGSPDVQVPCFGSTGTEP